MANGYVHGKHNNYSRCTSCKSKMFCSLGKKSNMIMAYDIYLNIEMISLCNAAKNDEWVFTLSHESYEVLTYISNIINPDGTCI